MKPNPNELATVPPSLMAAKIILLALFAGTAFGADPVKEDADQILRQMSAKLAAATSFSFQAKREMDPELLPAFAVPETAKITIAVQRPNRVAATSKSNLGSRRMLADGTTLTLVDDKMNLYASTPMAVSLDGLVEKLDEKYGFTPPLAEFILSDPYADFRKQATTVTYLGKVKTGGFLGLGAVECHRIGLQGPVADAELWVAVKDVLPRLLMANFHREGNPGLRVTFSHWDLAASLTPADFLYTPRKGAQAIEMLTTKQFESSIKP